MKRICFVLDSAFFIDKGGAELQAYYIGKELSKRGWDVHYIHRSKWKKRIVKDGITWHALPQIPRKFSLGLFLYIPLVELLDEIKPDIIYQRVQNIHTGLVGRYCNKRDVKFVWAVSSIGECEKKISQNTLKIILWYFNNQFAKWGIKQADKIIAQTKTQKEKLRLNFGLDSIVIPNSQTVPNPPFNKNDPPIVLWVANIKDLKRPEIFIKLAIELNNSNAKFVMVGRLPSNEDYRKKILNLISEAENVDYRGELPYKDVNEWVEQASIFVNTSLPLEGFPNTFIQAWLRETPVVSLTFDPDGLLTSKNIGIRSGNFKKMVKDVKNLLENPKERVKIGKKARKFAVKNYDIKNNIKKYENLFQQLVE